MNPPAFNYVGQELDVFSRAVNWKRYWGDKIRPFMGKRVLEVGAGIGGTTRVLCDARYDLWLGLEPDAAMVADLERQRLNGEFGDNCRFQEGTVQDLGDQQFDTILYIDVLEHIEKDGDELRDAATHVALGGHLIVLSPAYPKLFTEFDRAIGHYRRYTRASLSALAPPNLVLREAFYLDSFGLLTSLANLIFLHSPQPTVQQILFWDRRIVPISKFVDPLLRYACGRSIICVWQRPTS